MPPILTQMRGDTVSPRHLSHQGRAQRIRIGAASGVAQSGHVINIDA
jgi:hypothetical protein